MKPIITSREPWFAACLGLRLAFATSKAVAAETRKPDKPNVIFILADYTGVGDVQCLGGATSKIPTPYMDRLAKEGMVFNDAHSSSAVCTPTRYSIITGRYNWRSSRKSSVIGGIAKPLIETDRPIVARFMNFHGDVTGCIGKWHIGTEMPTTDGKEPRQNYTRSKSGEVRPLGAEETNIDWKGTIKGGRWHGHQPLADLYGSLLLLGEPPSVLLQLA